MSLWDAFAEEDQPPTAYVNMDQHAAWHRETGNKYNCPWDACHPPEPDRCPAYDCERYLDDDGTCVAAGDEAHVQFAADLMDLRLTLSLEPKAPPEPDPWF